MQKIKLLFFFSLALLSIESQAQIGLTGYSNYALGIYTGQNSKIATELKIFSSIARSGLAVEGDFFYNFNPGTYHKFSLGAGFRLEESGDTGLIIPVALQIFPLQDIKQLSLLMEFGPDFNIGDETSDEVDFRVLWGIRYTFTK